MHCRSQSPAETRALARSIAQAARDAGLVVGLIGPLGAGKTEFVRGLAEGLGIPGRRVSSPSFVIAAQHEGPHAVLVHVDLYRVESQAELEAAGWLDWLAPGQLVAVEWADRLDALPEDHLEVRIARVGGDAGQAARIEAPGSEEREVVLRARGPRAREVLARVLAAQAAGESDS